ncbi:MAG TPA: AAA family ATPase, partial [Myxococcales bacterium]|nr:AAA family ATPase [Myxococcales bacterium]
LDTLEALFDEAVQDPLSRAVLLCAPAGTGKSRLAAELVARLRERAPAPQIWCGRGDPLRAGSPFGLLASAIRNALGVHAGDPAEARAAAVRRRVAQLFANVANAERIAEQLTALLGDRRDRATDPQLAGDQLRHAFEQWIAAECASAPVLLLLEDLHWGDLPSIKFVDAALREDRPLMVLGLARPEVQQGFPGLWEGRRLEEMRLGPLTPKASARLAREALGPEARPGAIERIVQLGAGNALHLEELVRAAADGREGPPQTVLAMLQTRIEQLDAPLRQVLRAASVFGQRFWSGSVAALLRGEQVRDRLALLAEQEVIVRRDGSRFPGEDEHAFRHGLVREAAYAMLTEEDRALGHRLAGGWLAQHGETEALVLAEHCERGGQPALAVGHWRQAAEQALEGDDIEAALARARRALACDPQGETLGALMLLCADAHSWRGEHADAARSASEAMPHLPQASAPWFLAAGVAAEAWGKLGERRPLLDLAGQLLSVGRDPDGPQAVAFVRAAAQLLLLGHEKEASALIEAVEHAELGDARALAFVDHGRSVRALFHGDLGAYRELKAAAAKGFDAAGDRRNACAQKGKLGYSGILLGAYAEAEADLRAALALAERLGLRNVATGARHNLGLALALQGRLDEAEALERQSIDEFHQQRDNRLEQASRAYLGHILFLKGRLQPAASEVRHAVMRSSAASPQRAHALAYLAQILLAQGQVDDARRTSGEAMRLLGVMGGMDEGESLVRLVHAEALHATGAFAEAREALQQARARLRERASSITDARWRESFLTQVAENARTLALGEGWNG